MSSQVPVFLSSALAEWVNGGDLQFEILYSAGLFPPPALPPEFARRYRQNFMSNAREVVRVTGGKGVIFSSGPGGSGEAMRGPLDVVNLCARSARWAAKGVGLTE